MDFVNERRAVLGFWRTVLAVAERLRSTIVRATRLGTIPEGTRVAIESFTILRRKRQKNGPQPCFNGSSNDPIAPTVVATAQAQVIWREC